MAVRTDAGRIAIAPSILSADFGRLAEEVAAVEAAGADLVHVDVMDGHFVPNLTLGPPIVRAVRKATRLPLDVHLMIENADRYIEAFAEAGADILTVHVEANVHLHRVLQQIRSAGAKPAVVLNPHTPLCTIEHVLEDVEMVLLMSVNPGFGGQRFIPRALEKVRSLAETIRRRGLAVDIEVDGGVKVENARALSEAGATILVAGSAIFGARDYAEVIGALRREAALGSP
ncbi:MAG: ribulose-phosphate 3-epimerase [Deltaproteobacteria bacterium]|nr:MAG: ribulose-phosphate 3-epimerase [Deltaproteobacteria bacterium]